MDACRRLFPFLWCASVEMPREPVLGVREGPGALGSRAGMGRGRGSGRGRQHRHTLPGWDGPGSGFAGIRGRAESCGWGNWVRASAGDGFSAAGLSPLASLLQLAGLELPVWGITALTAE